MSDYLLIETRDPFESRDVERTFELARDLARTAKVTIFFAENGVLATRETGLVAQLGELGRAGVTLLADAFSLRERGIPEARLAGGVRAAPIDDVVTLLASGHKALWQ